jgi:capsular exopolysaccharide synthesis family protein
MENNQAEKTPYSAPHITMSSQSANVQEPLRKKEGLNFDIFRYFRKCVRFWWLFLVLVVCVSIPMAIAEQNGSAPKYTSSSTQILNIYRSAISPGSETGEAGDLYYQYLDLAATSRTLEQFQLLMMTDTVFLKTIDKMEFGGTPIDIDVAKSMVKIKPVEGTHIFTVSVMGDEEDKVYALIKAFVEVAPDVLKTINTDGVLVPLDDPSRARLSSPVSDPTAAAVKGAAVGFAAALAIVFMLDFLSTTVKNISDLENGVGTRILGVIPNNTRFRRRRMKRNLFGGRLIIDPGSGYNYIEAFKSLRTKIENYGKKNNTRIILVTSALEHEGKTTVTANIALSLAKKNHKVLLIDGDLRKPTAHRIFGYDNKIKIGITEILNETANFNQVKLKYPGSGLEILPCAKGLPDATERLASEEMKNLMDRISKLDYDFILIDAPPALFMSDAEILMRYADSLIVVVKEDVAPMTDVRATIANLASGNVNYLGAILNASRKRTGRFMLALGMFK